MMIKRFLTASLMLVALCACTGEAVRDYSFDGKPSAEVLDKVFGQFCIGK